LNRLQNDCDNLLWKKIINGDAEAFDTWYRENAPRLRSFLRHLLGNEQAAEDVMQGKFTQLWCRPHGFDPVRGTLRGYRFGTARRQAAEWWRRQKPTDSLEIESAAPGRAEATSVMADILR
jgi:RNA polymerase sigma-70 factor, ECF subfamily